MSPYLLASCTVFDSHGKILVRQRTRFTQFLTMMLLYSTVINTVFTWNVFLCRPHVPGNLFLIEWCLVLFATRSSALYRLLPIDEAKLIKNNSVIELKYFSSNV